MTTRDFIIHLKNVIEDIKSKGAAAVYCDNLIAYLSNFENTSDVEPTAIQIEKFKAELQIAIESHKYRNESNLEMFRSVITAGQSAIKTSFLLNGGGAVAILAFVGHIAQFMPNMVAHFANCLLPFAFGVLAIAATSGTTYIAQWLYAHSGNGYQKRGHRINIVAVVFGLISYSCFIVGVFMSHHELMRIR